MITHDAMWKVLDEVQSLQKYIATEFDECNTKGERDIIRSIMFEVFELRERIAKMHNPSFGE